MNQRRRKGKLDPWTPQSRPEFDQGLHVVQKDLDAAAKHFYTEMALRTLVRADAKVLSAVNTNAWFWTVVANAMHCAFFMALGRLLDAEQNAISMKRVVKFAIDQPELFFHHPHPMEFVKNRLRIFKRTVDEIERVWEANYQQIRHEAMAHQVLERTPGQMLEVYGKTDIRWIDRTIRSLEDISDGLWHLSHSAVAQEFQPRSISACQKSATDGVRREMRLLLGLDAQGSQDPAAWPLNDYVVGAITEPEE